MQSKGQIIGFIDGDGEISPRFIPRFYEEIKDGKIDVAVGKKQNMKKSVVRKVYSLGFRFVCLLLFGLPVETQTGIKLFDRKVKKLHIHNDSYLFDLELIIACKEKSMTIKEIPVELTCVQKCGRIGWRQAWQMLRGLINLKMGRQLCSGRQSCGYYLPW